MWRKYKFSITRIILLLLLPIWFIINCSTTNNIPALISDINEESENNSSRKVFITPKIQKRCKTFIKKRKSISMLYNVSQSNMKLIQSTKKITVLPKIIQKKNRRIVYMRKYKNVFNKNNIKKHIYNVQHGDTLFYIAWKTGNDFRNLAQRNKIFPPYNIYTGQKLQLGNTVKKFYSRNKTVEFSKSCTQDSIINSTKLISNNRISNTSISSWHWPTNGKVVENFFSTERGNKGIDIAGNKKQVIVATADGRVVYVGNALRGYGNLIVIKHNNNYLSAYAHNDIVLVREKQTVKGGQKIAFMGNSGTSSTRLHFEIRYKGKSVNPLKYLPKQ